MLSSPLSALSDSSSLPRVIGPWAVAVRESSKSTGNRRTVIPDFKVTRAVALGRGCSGTHSYVRTLTLFWVGQALPPARSRVWKKCQTPFPLLVVDRDCGERAVG